MDCSQKLELHQLMMQGSADRSVLSYNSPKIDGPGTEWILSVGP